MNSKKMKTVTAEPVKLARDPANPVAKS